MSHFNGSGGCFYKRQLFQRASSTARNRALEAQNKPHVLRVVMTYIEIKVEKQIAVSIYVLIEYIIEYIYNMFIA